MSHLHLSFDISLLAISGGADLLNQNSQAATQITESWATTWEQFISPNSPIYKAIIIVARYIAIISLIFWGAQATYDYIENKSVSLAHTIIWPLICVYFLSGNGLRITDFALSIRNIINQTNQAVLENVAAEVSLQSAYDKVKANQGARAQIGALLSQCQALVGEQQFQCLDNAQTQAEEIVQMYGLEGNWVTNLGERINQAKSGARNGVEGFFAPFSALIGAANQSIAQSFLLGMQQAFQQGIEASLLVTAYLAPLAMGVSLLPSGAPAIFAWVTGMFTVGLIKLCYNIMVGTAAVAILNADPGEMLWYLLYGAILAPTVAFALARGGGAAILESITSFTLGTVNRSVNLATQLV